MAYNYYPQTYQTPVYYPTQSNAFPTQMNVGPTQPNTQSSTDIKWVQGEAGAKSYMVGPNTSVTLWDSEAQTIYIKSANASGLPTMTVIDYTIRDNTPQAKPDSATGDFATKDDISALEKEISSLRSKFERMNNAGGDKGKEKKNG